MRKLFLSVLIVTSLCATALAGTIQNDIVQLTIPNDWSQVEMEGTAIAAKSNSADYQLPPNVNVVREDMKGSFTAKQYMDAAMNYFKKTFPNVKVIRSGSNFWVIENDYGNNIVARQAQYFYTKGNFGYVLTFTALATDYDSVSKAFETIEKSIKLK
jgi:hypothetical protein